MSIIFSMSGVSDLDRIFIFLELELSKSGLEFFLKVKKCYEKDMSLFEDFIVDYLSLQSDETVSSNDDIYKKFFLYFKNMMNLQTENDFLEQFARYAKYYLMLNYEYIKNDDFKHWISIINKFRGKVAYPFLMELLDDYEHGRINQEDLNQMALMVVNLLRNSNLEGAELRQEFSQLGTRVNKMLTGEIESDLEKKVS